MAAIISRLIGLIIMTYLGPMSQPASSCKWYHLWNHVITNKLISYHAGTTVWIITVSWVLWQQWWYQTFIACHRRFIIQLYKYVGNNQGYHLPNYCCLLLLQLLWKQKNIITSSQILQQTIWHHTISWNEADCNHWEWPCQ